MIDDKDILKAARRILDGKSHLLKDDMAERIAGLLNAMSEGSAEACRQAASGILDLLSGHSDLWGLFCDEMGVSRETLCKTTRGYAQLCTPAPGPIPPGAWMVCPEDGCHHRRRLRQVGNRLFCPVHGKALIPQPR